MMKGCSKKGHKYLTESLRKLKKKNPQNSKIDKFEEKKSQETKHEGPIQWHMNLPKLQ